jgi:hypothetical protein
MVYLLIYIHENMPMILSKNICNTAHRIATVQSQSHIYRGLSQKRVQLTCLVFRLSWQQV